MPRFINPKQSYFRKDQRAETEAIIRYSFILRLITIRIYDNLSFPEILLLSVLYHRDAPKSISDSYFTFTVIVIVLPFTLAVSLAVPLPRAVIR